MAALADTSSTRQRPRYARILVATTLAGGASAGLNAVLRYAAVAAFDIPQPQYEPLNLASVVISSLLGAGAGGAFFAALAWLTRRPIRVFLGVATAALALSMIPVLTVNAADPPPYVGAGIAAGVTLALMHLVVAVVLTGALRWAQPTLEDRWTQR
jgi:hypothetical protein